jgi:hypothetical protein
MGLLNENGAAAPAKPGVGTGVASGNVGAPAKGEDEAKKSNAYEYQKKRLAKIREGAQRILAKKAQLPSLDATDVEFLNWLNREPGTREGGGNFGTPIFNKIFGDKPAVGQKVTLQEIFDKTYKGKGQMDSMMKKWKEKNDIDILFTFNAEKPATSTYEIKSLG